MQGARAGSARLLPFECVGLSTSLLQGSSQRCPFLAPIRAACWWVDIYFLMQCCHVGYHQISRLGLGSQRSAPHGGSDVASPIFVHKWTFANLEADSFGHGSVLLAALWKHPGSGQHPPLACEADQADTALSSRLGEGLRIDRSSGREI